MNRAAMRFLGATFGALVLITPAASQIPNLKTGATVPAALGHAVARDAKCCIFW